MDWSKYNVLNSFGKSVPRRKWKFEWLGGNFESKLSDTVLFLESREKSDYIMIVISH